MNLTVESVPVAYTSKIGCIVDYVSGRNCCIGYLISLLSLFLDIIRKHKKIINKMKYIDVRKNVRYNIDDTKNLVIQFIRERQ